MPALRFMGRAWLVGAVRVRSATCAQTAGACRPWLCRFSLSCAARCVLTGSDPCGRAGCGGRPGTALCSGRSAARGGAGHPGRLRLLLRRRHLLPHCDVPVARAAGRWLHCRLHRAEHCAHGRDRAAGGGHSNVVVKGRDHARLAPPRAAVAARGALTRERGGAPAGVLGGALLLERQPRVPRRVAA